MAKASKVDHLRRYVLERAAGRVPRKEYARYDHGVGAWIRCDEAEVRESIHWRCLRRPATPWCPVLGPQTEIHHDDALQAFFATIAEDEWSRLSTTVRKRPAACLREWKQAGQRILYAVSGDYSGSEILPGRLAQWPTSRGAGQRILVQNGLA